MSETLLSPSNILLFGRVVSDLLVRHDAANESAVHQPFTQPSTSQNNFLQAQLAHADARFARIYAFVYEGYLYELAQPAMFLVHGDGEPAEHRCAATAAAEQTTATSTGPSPRAVAPDEADKTGVAVQGYSFAEDIRVWSYDKGDFSIRLDVETGPFEQILLEAAIEMDAAGSGYAGAKVAGAKVAGAKVAGAKVAGAKVAGAKLGLRRGDE